MECKIICDGKEAATFNCTDDGCNMKWTAEGKKLRKKCCNDIKGCC